MKEPLLAILEERFNTHMYRHEGIVWEEVRERMIENEALISTLFEMEATGGEIDVMVYKDQLLYIDFSQESPIGRRNVCYDVKALKARKNNKPERTVEELVKWMNATLVDEELYHALQRIEPVDLKTSSWLVTPLEIRVLKGAIFGDRRYNHVFVYHNGADSYYAARGFRVYTII